MKKRWKNNPKPTGLAAVCAGPQGSIFHDGKVTFAWTGYISGKFHGVTGWYWVSPVNEDFDIGFNNTSRDPVETQDEAKKQAADYINSRFK
jgi:hypothetical protein